MTSNRCTETLRTTLITIFIFSCKRILHSRLVCFGFFNSRIRRGHRRQCQGSQLGEAEGGRSCGGNQGQRGNQAAVAAAAAAAPTAAGATVASSIVFGARFHGEA